MAASRDAYVDEERVLGVRVAAPPVAEALGTSVLVPACGTCTCGNGDRALGAGLLDAERPRDWCGVRRSTTEYGAARRARNGRAVDDCVDTAGRDSLDLSDKRSCSDCVLEPSAGTSSVVIRAGAKEGLLHMVGVVPRGEFFRLHTLTNKIRFMRLL